jgi:hypothetical protein
MGKLMRKLVTATIAASIVSSTVLATSFEDNRTVVNNKFEWYYNPSDTGTTNDGVDIPEDFPYQLANHLNDLEQFCNVDFIYKGPTTVKNVQDDNLSVLRWDSTTPGGYTLWSMSSTVPVPQILSADVTLTAKAANSTLEALGIAKHEFLHAIGFLHTTVSDSIMTIPYMQAYRLLGRFKYDTNECQRLYGVRKHTTKLVSDLAYHGNKMDANIVYSADAIDFDTSRNVYVVAFYKNTQFMLTPNGWVSPGYLKDAPYKVIDKIAATQTINILTDFDFSPFVGSGAQIYVGVGRTIDNVQMFKSYALLVSF